MPGDERGAVDATETPMNTGLSVSGQPLREDRPKLQTFSFANSCMGLYALCGSYVHKVKWACIFVFTSDFSSQETKARDTEKSISRAVLSAGVKEITPG